MTQLHEITVCGETIDRVNPYSVVLMYMYIYIIMALHSFDINDFA